jgi:hypothetical protein
MCDSKANPKAHVQGGSQDGAAAPPAEGKAEDFSISFVVLLFVMNFVVNFTGGIIMPIRESLTLFGGKSLQAFLMGRTLVASIAFQTIIGGAVTRLGPSIGLQITFLISALVILTAILQFRINPSESENEYTVMLFYFWFSYYVVSSTSIFWTFVGDVTKSKSQKNMVSTFGHVVSGGTLGRLFGALAATMLLSTQSRENCLIGVLIVYVGCFLSMFVVHAIKAMKIISIPSNAGSIRSSGPVPDSAVTRSVSADSTGDANGSTMPVVTASKLRKKFTVARFLNFLKREARENIAAVREIWATPILRNAFLYSILASVCYGLTMIERNTSAKKASMASDTFGSVIARNQFAQGIFQFSLQLLFTGKIISYMGPVGAYCLSSLGRQLQFILLLGVSCAPVWMDSWSHASFEYRVSLVVYSDLICTMVSHTLIKPLREVVWMGVPSTCMYKSRSKVIIDVFAHRIGTTLAAFVSTLPIAFILSSTLDLVVPSVVTELTKSFDFNKLITALDIEAHQVWGLLAASIQFFVAFQLGFGVMTQHHIHTGTKESKSL